MAQSNTVNDGQISRAGIEAIERYFGPADSEEKASWTAKLSQMKATVNSMMRQRKAEGEGGFNTKAKRKVAQQWVDDGGQEHDGNDIPLVEPERPMTKQKDGRKKARLHETREYVDDEGQPIKVSKFKLEGKTAQNAFADEESEVSPTNKESTQRRTKPQQKTSKPFLDMMQRPPLSAFDGLENKKELDLAGLTQVAYEIIGLQARNLKQEQEAHSVDVEWLRRQRDNAVKFFPSGNPWVMYLNRIIGEKTLEQPYHTTSHALEANLQILVEGGFEELASDIAQQCKPLLARARDCMASDRRAGRSISPGVPGFPTVEAHELPEGSV